MTLISYAAARLHLVQMFVLFICVLCYFCMHVVHFFIFLFDFSFLPTYWFFNLYVTVIIC